MILKEPIHGSMTSMIATTLILACLIKIHLGTNSNGKNPRKKKEYVSYTNPIAMSGLAKNIIPKRFQKNKKWRYNTLPIKRREITAWLERESATYPLEIYGRHGS